jgi:protein-disulfide isomerase
VTKTGKATPVAKADRGVMVRRILAITVLIVALGGVGGAAVIVANSGNQSIVFPTAAPTVLRSTATAANPLTASPTPLGPPVPTVKPAARVEHVKGPATAKVTIIEYSDFQCPFCAQYATTTYLQLDEKYIKTGKIKYVFRPLALSGHRQAQKAAETAECAGDQGKYWEMHDMLFARQAQWSEKGGAVEIFKGYAKTLGLDEATFAQCLDGGKFVNIPNENGADATRAGIEGTPTFFINNTVIPGAFPLADFVRVIEAELAK